MLLSAAEEEDGELDLEGICDEELETVSNSTLGEQRGGGGGGGRAIEQVMNDCKQ